MDAVNRIRAERGDPIWEELAEADTMEEAVAWCKELKHGLNAMNGAGEPRGASPRSAPAECSAGGE